MARVRQLGGPTRTNGRTDRMESARAREHQEFSEQEQRREGWGTTEPPDRQTDRHLADVLSSFLFFSHAP